MGERHEMLGQRAEILPQRQRLLVECAVLRDNLREALPVHEDVEILNGENIINSAIILHARLTELAGLNRKIRILNEQLGM
jgi:hypothetical protein